MADEPVYSMLSGKCSSGFVLSGFPAPNCDMQDYYNYAGCSDCFCTAVLGSYTYGLNPNRTYNYSSGMSDGILGIEPGYTSSGNTYSFIHNLDYACNGGNTDQKWLMVYEGCSGGFLATAPGTQGNFPTTGWTMHSDTLSLYRDCVGCGANDPASFNLTFTCL
jgi:hypothetical protein